MQSVLYCQRAGCPKVLAVLPGLWKVVRPVEPGERVPEGSGVLVCHVTRDRAGRVRSGCGTRYEVVLMLDEMEAALRREQDERRAA